jgi:hypothetical protein
MTTNDFVTTIFSDEDLIKFCDMVRSVKEFMESHKIIYAKKYGVEIKLTRDESANSIVFEFLGGGGGGGMPPLRTTGTGGNGR